MQRRSRDGKTKVGVAKERPAKLEPLRDDAAASATNKNQTSRNDSKEPKTSKIPRNVNFYRHLINDKYASENDIEWVLKLRSPSALGGAYKMGETSTQAFNVGDKDLECQKLGRTYSDIQTKNKPFQVQHLYVKRLGPTVSQGTVQFECGLRDYAAQSDKLKALEKNWSNIPKKDRVTKNDFAPMYPSYDETLKIKSWSTKNLNIATHTGFDGYQSYPKYDDLCDKMPKNVQSIRHLLCAPGQQMANAGWQLSMRNYGGNPKPARRQETNEDDNGNSNGLGELKKINRNPKRI